MYEYVCVYYLYKYKIIKQMYILKDIIKISYASLTFEMLKVEC